jgi:HAD superfamily phosphatase (TIGR01668 family)
MDKYPFLCYNLHITYEAGSIDMTFPLLPTFRVPCLTDLTADMLRKQNIRLLMLDFDNTIVPYTTDIPTDAVRVWIEEMRNTDIQLCVVSNSHNSRVKIFCEKYGLDCITHAKKPFSKGIRQCLERYGIPASASALVGDQIYTDTLGANCAGVRSILVQAIHNHTIWLKLRHVAEMPFILIAGKRRIDNDKS